VLRKFNSAPRCICPLYPKNIFQNVKKKSTKFFAFTYSQSKSVCKFLPKTDTFCGLCKKDKNCHLKCHSFSTTFNLFYTRHMTRRFVVQRFCGHVAHKDVRAHFLFQFFNILKYVKYVFQNIRSICSHEPKHHSPCACPSISMCSSFNTFSCKEIKILSIKLIFCREFQSKMWRNFPYQYIEHINIYTWSFSNVYFTQSIDNLLPSIKIVRFCHVGV
jgi:hypothetical protein